MVAALARRYPTQLVSVVTGRLAARHQLLTHADIERPPGARSRLADELEKKILEKLGVGPTVDAEAPLEPVGVDDF